MSNQTGLVYKKDRFGKDLLVDVDRGEVMTYWEKPYMEALVDKLNPFGDVLEIGFGLGYSANAIQKYDINSHTIIECDSTVLERTYEWAKKQKHKVVIIEGTWEDQEPLLDQRFDSLFFDDYPLYYKATAETRTMTHRCYKFCDLLMEKNINKNARFTHFSTMKLKNETFTVLNPCRMNVTRECEEFNITLPDDVRQSLPFSFRRGLYITKYIFNTGSSIKE